MGSWFGRSTERRRTRESESCVCYAIADKENTRKIYQSIAKVAVSADVGDCNRCSPVESNSLSCLPSHDAIRSSCIGRFGLDFSPSTWRSPRLKHKTTLKTRLFRSRLDSHVGRNPPSSRSMIRSKKAKVDVHEAVRVEPTVPRLHGPCMLV